MKHITVGLVGLLLLGSGSSLQADETDGEKALKKIAESRIGGVWRRKREGESDVVRRYRWILNNRFLECKEEADGWSNMMLIGVDPDSKKLTHWSFGTNGNVVTGTITPKDDGTTMITAGGTHAPSGTKWSWLLKITDVSENEYRREWVEVIHGGEIQELPASHTWVRHKE